MPLPKPTETTTTSTGTQVSVWVFEHCDEPALKIITASCNPRFEDHTVLLGEYCESGLMPDEAREIAAALLAAADYAEGKTNGE